MRQEPPPEDPAARSIAYMVGTFPALTETFVLREIGGMRRRGLRVTVMAVRRPTGVQATAGELGADVPCRYARPDGLARHAAANVGAVLTRPGRYFAALGIFRRAGAGLPLRDRLQLLYHFFAGVGFARDLRRTGIAHVHGHFASATNMALAAHLVEAVPFSFTAHASDDLFVAPVLLAEKVAAATFVVAESEYARRYLDGATGFRFSRKLRRIYNGVTPGEAERLGRAGASAPPRRGLTDTPRILAVGTLVPQKGHATLIQICAALRARGHRFQCRIIGKGPERETLERLIRLHQLEDHVELLGPLSLDRVYAEMLDADVFAFLAEIGPKGSRDGFPTVILEAMAAGLPVLATTLVGIPEMVADGVTGLLVPERDVEAAGRALERLLASPAMRRAMGEAGKARVHELFDLDRSVGALAEMLAGPRPRAHIEPAHAG